MASKKRLILLLVGLILGVGIASEDINVLTANTVAVDVALQNIPVGTKITTGMITTKLIRSTDIEPQVYKSSAKLGSSYALISIPAGTQITKANTSAGSQGGLETEIPKGYVSFKVPATSITGLSTKLHVGDRVDIIASVPANTTSGQTQYQTGVLESNCLVLGVSTDSSNAMQGVLLAVRSTTALDLSQLLASSNGSSNLIRLMMRGYANQNMAIPGAIDNQNLPSAIQSH